jgi:hypothetical protein
VSRAGGAGKEDRAARTARCSDRRPDARQRLYEEPTPATRVAARTGNDSMAVESRSRRRSVPRPRRPALSREGERRLQRGWTLGVRSRTATLDGSSVAGGVVRHGTKLASPFVAMHSSGSSRRGRSSPRSANRLAARGAIDQTAHTAISGWSRRSNRPTCYTRTDVPARRTCTSVRRLGL